jgi:hypothetical protein
MPDFALSVEASPMATNDPIPLFLSDHIEEPEQPGIGKAWDRAAISSRILKTSILVATAAAIVFAIRLVGNPLVLFTNATASLVATSAPQDGTGQSMPIIQSTVGDQALPPTAREAPTGDEIAAAFNTADQSQTENPQPPAEALFKQYQAWAAEEDARTPRPLQPEQDAQHSSCKMPEPGSGPYKSTDRPGPCKSTDRSGPSKMPRHRTGPCKMPRHRCPSKATVVSIRDLAGSDAYVAKPRGIAAQPLYSKPVPA